LIYFKTANIGHYFCVGFKGSMCELRDVNSACYENPCKHSGACVLQGSLHNYTCLCLSGYTGKNCYNLPLPDEFRCCRQNMVSIVH